MKKITASLISLLLILLFFSCTIPSGIEVTGRAGIKDLTMNFRLSEEISKSIRNNIASDGEDSYTVAVQECINVTDVSTFLIHKDIPVENFKSPKIESIMEIDNKVSDWLTDTYPGYTGGDTDTFIEDQVDNMALDLNIQNDFEFGNQTIPVPVDWQDELKTKIKQNTAGAAPSAIDNIIKETIREEAPKLILDSKVYIGTGVDAAESDGSFEMSRIDISDYLDFTKMELDDFRSIFYFSVLEKDGTPSDFLDDSEIFMKLGETIIFNYEDLKTNRSGIDITKEEYEELSLPAGMESDFEDMVNSGLFSDDENKLNVDIIIRVEDKYYTLSDFTKEYELKVELVLWLPLSIKAKEEYNFKLPLDFEKDMFNRKSDDPAEVESYISAAGLEFVFSENIFPQTHLIINNINGKTGSEDEPLFYKDFPITSRSLKANFNKDDVKKLDNPVNNPFTPDFSILLDVGGSIIIPKELELEKFSLWADINYKDDF